MKKITLITSIVMVVLVLGVVLSSMYTDLSFDISVLVDTTAYHDSDSYDIKENIYMCKTMISGIHIMIPCTDTYTIVRVSKTREYIEVYRVGDIIGVLILIGLIIYLIKFLIRLKNRIEK